MGMVYLLALRLARFHGLTERPFERSRRPMFGGATIDFPRGIALGRDSYFLDLTRNRRIVD